MTPLPIMCSKQLEPGVPFSLTCYGCDAGMDIETPERAALLGWIYVYRDTWGDGISWNYLGMCPDCQREEQPCTS